MNKETKALLNKKRKERDLYFKKHGVKLTDEELIKYTNETTEHLLDRIINRKYNATL